MNTYRFETTATMKEYNRRKYWIDAGIIRPVKVQAENLKAALQLYRETVNDRDYIQISENAIKNPSPMFIDLKDGTTKQTGFVITAVTEIETDNYKYSKQYIDLWVDVSRLAPVDFEGV